MEKLSIGCPQCREPYSIRLPSTQYYSRCSLPLTLECGHGVCYHCVYTKRPNQKHGSPVANDCKFSTISCAVCHTVSSIPREAVRNVLALIDCYQLGLVQLEELAVEVAGENIGFKDGSDGLFVPISPQLSLKTTPLVSPEKCFVHNFVMEFWCYEDEVSLCRICRISSHLQHDLVKIEDRNKDEMESFYSMATETAQLVEDINEACNEIKEQTKRVQIEYDFAIKEMRHHFSDLHKILAAREQQVQRQLFETFQKRTIPLKKVERYMREACQDINFQLQKAATAVSDQTPPSRSSVTRWTESIGRFNCYEAVIKETVDNLKSVTLSTKIEPIPEYAHHLLHDPVACVSSTDDVIKYWTQVHSQYDDLKQTTNKQLIKTLNSKSPCKQMENKKARKHQHATVSSVAANHPCHVGSELTCRVVYIDSQRFYIHIQNDLTCPDAASELGHLLQQIQTCGREPAPGLDALHVGQMVAGMYQGTWYRALVEEINLKCKDLVVFFIDYGNRELTSVQSVRLLNDDMKSFPAQAIRCALSKNTALSELLILSPEINFVRIQLDRVEQGGVGHLDGKELTFWVTLCQSTGNQNHGLPSDQPEPVDPSVAWPPPKLHKIKTVPSPPPAGAMTAKRKRFPAKDWVPRTRIAAAVSSISTNSKFKDVSMPAAIVLPLAANYGQENRHRTKILASHLSSPGDFYVRIESTQKTYLNLIEQLDHHLSVSCGLEEILKPADMTTIGLICAVQLDGQWNRCRIVGTVDDQKARVQLIDVGQLVNCTQLHLLDQRRWMATPAMAIHCRLWGVRPAGHATKWSGSSFDKMKDVIKKSDALFMQVYFIQEEEIEDSGLFSSVHYVRFYYEYVQPGGPMEFDQTLTCCLNDELLDLGLALRDAMPVTVQPVPKTWPPSVGLPPELANAIPVWLDEEGLLYFHPPAGPTNHLSVINKLLQWHYHRSKPSAADLAHWIKDEPCVVLSTDKKWYRAVVQSCDDETQTASVFYVDYGNAQDDIAYEHLRKSLLCYEYPIQAHRCRLARFPGRGFQPDETELATLHQLLVDQRMTIRLIDTEDGIPTVDIQYTEKEDGKKILDEMFHLLASSCRYRSTPIVEPVVQSASLASDPALTGPFSSVDADDSILDSSAFSDDVSSIFNFDLTKSLKLKETDFYRPLDICRRVSLPVRILSIVDENRGLAVVQPTRHRLKDSPSRWQQQVEGYHQLQAELQRCAPLSPDIDVGELDRPCACKYEEEWYRGKIAGYVNDDLSIVKVELVDIGITLNVTSHGLKQLPTEYLSLPRHSIVCSLIDSNVSPSYPPSLNHLRVCMKENMHFTAFFKEINDPLQMRLFYRDRRGKLIPAIE